MTRRNINAGILASAAVAGGPVFGAEDAKTIALPAPRSKGGKPLIEALALRRSTREYAPGRCRHRSCRTSYGRPSASIVRVAIARPRIGVTSWSSMSMRRWPTAFGSTSRNSMRWCRTCAPTSAHRRASRISSAPPRSISIYVAHGERMQDIAPQERRLYASVDTGFIGQNVYLFCASEGLATVFRGAVDYAKLDQTMHLGKEEFVTFAQTVGYPRS